MAKKKKSNNAKAWEIGGAITAATMAAAAGAYLLSDKKTITKVKKKAKKLVVDARKEALKNAKMAKKLGKKEYGRMVDRAVKRYGPLKKLTVADMIAAGKELKGKWKKMHVKVKRVAKAYAPKKAAKKKKSTKKKRV